MTLRGNIPSLLDDLGAPEGAFQSYCRSHEILLSSKKRPGRMLLGWRPWWSEERWPIVRACRDCIQQAGFVFYRLAWRLPILSCCPDHGLMLERLVLGRVDECYWPDKRPEAAGPELRIMDQRTLTALNRGMVELPGCVVSAATWFRFGNSHVAYASMTSSWSGNSIDLVEISDI